MDSLTVKGVFVVLEVLAERGGRAGRSSVSSDCVNVCPKLGRAIVKRFQNVTKFVDQRPEFAWGEDDKLQCVRLTTFGDQLSLLLLADLVRDANDMAALQDHIMAIAPPELKQWLEKHHRSSVAAYVALRPDLFVVRDGRLHEKDEMLAPADMEGAVAEAIAKKLATRGRPETIQVLGPSFANENRMLAARMKAKYGSLHKMLEVTKRPEFELLSNGRLGLAAGRAKEAGRAENVKVEKVARAAAPAGKEEEPQNSSGVIVKKVEKTKYEKVKVVKKGEAAERAAELAIAACIKILEAKGKVELGYLGGKMDQSGVDMLALRAVYGTFKEFVRSRAELILNSKGVVTLAASFDEKEFVATVLKTIEQRGGSMGLADLLKSVLGPGGKIIADRHGSVEQFLKKRPELLVEADTVAVKKE